MSNLETYDNGGQLAASGMQLHPAPIPKSQFQAAAVDAIDQEIEVIEKAAKVVPTLIRGGMAPDRYLPTFSPRKGAPAQGEEKAFAAAMAAAVYGATLGMGVAKSLQNVFTVHGTPSIYARTAVALAVARGHKVWTVEETDTAVTVSAQRRGSDHVETRTFTIAQAEQAGFTTNQKYKTQPREMLYAKAAMNVCRKAFPDVLEGIPLSVEELELEGPRIQVTARRMDRPARGTAGLDAALNPGKSTAPEPADDANDEAFIAEATKSIEALDTTDAVEGFIETLKSSGPVPEPIIAAGHARWREIANDNQEGNDNV